MLYNSVDRSLISLGHDTTSVGSGTMRSLYYDGGAMQIAERDRYVEIDGIDTNAYNKRQIFIKSKVFTKMVSDIVACIQAQVETPVTSPILSDGNIRVAINSKTRFTKLHDRSPYTKSLDDCLFDACVSLSIPSIYTGNGKTSIQIYANEVVVTNVRNSDLDINLDKLRLAD